MEFEVGGQVYRIGSMDVFKQFEVARRLAPVLMFLATAKQQPTAASFAQSFAAVTGSMAPDDMNAAIHTCLASVCRRQQGGIFAPINPSPGLLAFQDISMRDMLDIVHRVLVHHGIIDFFSLPAAGSTEATATESRSNSSQ